MKKKLIVMVIGLALYGCDAIMGKEVARLSINKTSNAELVVKETTLNLKKGEEIAFWTDMDLKYDNGLSLVYTVEVWKDSKKQNGFELNALKPNLTVMEVKTTLGNTTTWSFSGKIGSLDIVEDGNYTFKAALNSSDNPSLILNKAELVLKK